MILIEGDHLREYLLGNCVDWGEGERRNGDLDIGKSANDGLHLRVVNAIKWLDNHQVILLLCIFEDRRFDRCEVLLVREVDMIEKRALTWKERAG